MKKLIIVVVAVFIILIAIGIYLSQNVPEAYKVKSSSLIRVVAAENFYGDIVKQLGGNKVSVVSILSNPNVDPHEYESSISDAIAIANASIVIENGDNYDTWIDKLLSASPSSKRIVLVGRNIAVDPLTDNPHVWYGIDNIKAIAGKIAASLEILDPSNSQIFAKNLSVFDNSLKPLQKKIADIKLKFNGTPVGLTETIYLYQSQPEGLDVLTPFGFEKAIAEGNDPSASDVAAADNQITQKKVKVLIYNVQTVTSVTTNLQDEARQEGIPIVPVSETMPIGKHYQSWMMDQLTVLENALKISVSKKK